MDTALLVDGTADSRAVAGQDCPQIGELRLGTVPLDQLGDAEAARAARTVNG